jgi:hypothetical protein
VLGERLTAARRRRLGLDGHPDYAQVPFPFFNILSLCGGLHGELQERLYNKALSSGAQFMRDGFLRKDFSTMSNDGLADLLHMVSGRSSQ